MMTIESKRRAVFTVLSDYLREDSLWRAMWRWQNHFSDKSQYELNGFLSQCRDIPEVMANRPQLYRQLLSILMDSKVSLKPDPMEQMLAFQAQWQASGAATDDPDSRLSDWSEVFSRVLTTLFTQLRSDTARQVKRYATEQAVRSGMPQTLTYAFTLWDESGDLMDVSSATLPQLKQLLNYAYIGTCEYLGPVDADRVLSQAVRAAAAFSRSPLTDPRRLLEK